MKKVILVAHVGDFVPHFEMNNVKTLQAMGFEVHYAANFSLLSYGNSFENLKGSGVVCHELPIQRSPFSLENLVAHKMLKAILAAGDFALLHCHTPMGAVIARLAARPFRKRGLKVIYTAHGFHFYKGAPLKNWLFYYPVERFLSLFTDVQITINKEDFDLARKKLFAKKVTYVPGVGVDTQKLFQRTLQERASFRHSLGLKEADFCVVAVGELIVRKNHATLIDAMRIIGGRNVKAFICGTGGEEQSLRRKIRESHLEETVKLLGYRSDIDAIYEAADAFLFPSWQEGLSAALMESMAKGLPAVASRIRGNVDLIQEGKGGFLVDPSKPEEFAEAILKLAQDRDLATRMGAHNKQAIRSFDKEQSATAVRAIYEATVGTTAKLGRGGYLPSAALRAHPVAFSLHPRYPLEEAA